MLLPGILDLSVLPGTDAVSCPPNESPGEAGVACVSIERTALGHATLFEYFSALEARGWSEGLELPDRFVLDKRIVGSNCARRLVLTLPDYEASPDSERFLLRLATLREPVCSDERDQ